MEVEGTGLVTSASVLFSSVVIALVLQLFLKECANRTNGIVNARKRRVC